MKNKKVAFVTGGSRGIGRSIVMELIHMGFYVIFTYKSRHEQAEDVEKEAASLGGTAIGYVLDVRNREAVKRLIDNVIKEIGYVDVLINNAGIIQDRTLVFMKEKEWDDVLQVNLYGTFHVTQRILFYMLKRKKGRIINISSVSGLTGTIGQVNYSSTKAGIIGFTHSLAKEVAKYGVTVNCVAPAGVLTEIIDSIDEKARTELESLSPMKRLCKPEEVAKVVGFLSDTSLCPDYVNGAVIPIDGGMGIR